VTDARIGIIREISVSRKSPDGIRSRVIRASGSALFQPVEGAQAADCATG
jgi:hypothetical protein